MNHKNILFGIWMVLLSIVVSTQSMAWKRYRYGMGGCGVVTVFLKDRTQTHEMGKAFADFYFGLGSTNTSAMTSGTSNCTHPAYEEMTRLEQEVFVTANLNSISKEAAMGEGEHLGAFAEVLGCNVQDFVTFSRKNHAEIFSEGDPVIVLKNYHALIKKDATLSKSCERVI